MEKIVNAFNKNTLKRFILKKMFSRCAESIEGQITGIDEHFIDIEIYEIDQTNLNLRAKYEIDFILNRLPYQVQHFALDCVQTHNLFRNFINNPLLDNRHILNESEGKPNGTAQVEW